VKSSITVQYRACVQLILAQNKIPNTNHCKNSRADSLFEYHTRIKLSSRRATAWHFLSLWSLLYDSAIRRWISQKWYKTKTSLQHIVTTGNLHTPYT